MSDVDLRTRIAAALNDEFTRRGRVAEWLDLADAVIRELNNNCIGYQIWNAAEWISVNSGWVPYEIYRNVDGTGGGWRVTVQRIEADDE